MPTESSDFAKKHQKLGRKILISCRSENNQSYKLQSDRAGVVYARAPVNLNDNYRSEYATSCYQLII